MKTNLQLQKDVMDELQFEPSVDPADIGVTAHNGVIKLSGKVRSYAEKWSAVRAAERIRGVKAVVDDIIVELTPRHRRTDEDIAHAVLNALQWNVVVPEDRIKVHVENGWVILKGTVDYRFQLTAIEHAVRHLVGVTEITNHIKVMPAVMPSQVKTTIENAMRRAAESDAKGIHVDVNGHTVTLRGEVHSWGEREQAERAAWSAPGVGEVEDHLVIA